MKKLQSIMPIANIPSVMEHGILCHTLAGILPHDSVAMQSAQEKRAGIKLPDGRPLHDFANVYFHARNPMIYKRRPEAAKLCVLQISEDVLKLKDVWVSDGNAASAGYTKFCRVEEMHDKLEWEIIYAQSWCHKGTNIADPVKKRIKQAEALVYECIHPKFIQGAYVIDLIRKQKLEDVGFELPIEISADLFFKSVN